MGFPADDGNKLPSQDLPASPLLEISSTNTLATLPNLSSHNTLPFCTLLTLSELITLNMSEPLHVPRKRITQPPRKSTGGGRPLRCVPHSRTFLDHASQPVTSLVLSPFGLDCHLVSLQVYPLTPLVDPLAIAHGLLSYETSRDFGDKTPRVDIYAPQPSLEACMAHQRAEKLHRKETGGLYIIPTWHQGNLDFIASRAQHRNFIVVIDSDCSDWTSVQAKGVTIVLFDWVDSFEDDIKVYSAGDSEVQDFEMVEVIPPGEDPLILRGLLKKEDEKMLYSQWEPGVMTREERDQDRRLYFGSFFRDLSYGLPQCYGGYLECDDCKNGVEHDKCTVKA